MNKKIVQSVEDWNTVVTDLLATSVSSEEHASVVVLSGDLGVGKTTFVQVLAKQLGVEESVTSPTFTLMKRYEPTHGTFEQLVHMDAYRLESVDELRSLRFDELLQTPHTLVVIEWGERIAEALPEYTEWYVLDINSDGFHTIQSGRKE
jgi:tRNA threonylcarbamoyladenosine biosynthesis protein TsaE